MDFLYGVALMVAGFIILDIAVGSANARIVRHPFLDEAVSLVTTCAFGFGMLFLFFGMAGHVDALHVTELGLSIAVILMSIRGVRRGLLRAIFRKAPAPAR